MYRKPRDSEIDAYGLTHTGLVRPNNQDHFLIGSLRQRFNVRQSSLPHVDDLPLKEDRLASLMMVADGVGGGPGMLAVAPRPKPARTAIATTAPSLLFIDASIELMVLSTVSLAPFSPRRPPAATSKSCHSCLPNSQRQALARVAAGRGCGFHPHPSHNGQSHSRSAA